MLAVCCLFLSCDSNFESPSQPCDKSLVGNASFAEIKSLYKGETVQIQEELIIEGYVISSDEEGNFFSVLHFQDAPQDPQEAFQIEIDVRDSHLFYPLGSKIFVKLKGLYLGKSGNAFKLGATFESFGNVSVGRLPAAVVNEHVVRSCDEVIPISPVSINIDGIENYPTGILVQLDNLEFIEEELSLPFANEAEETIRTLISCNDQEIDLVNSGYSDFQAESIPALNGAVTGLLIDGALVIRGLKDLNFVNERCPPFIDEFTSNEIFFTELADPDNNAGARFVEIYNAAETPLSLKGWTLVRYTNANTEISATAELSDYRIGAGETLVISPNAPEFERVYGFIPDVALGSNSPADSNGDDNLQLIDPFGAVIDTFGVIGEDGSGTDHEFEDGRAVRRPEISRANAIYNPIEWILFNDTGAEETTNLPQMAPNDFSPGIRN